MFSISASQVTVDDAFLDYMTNSADGIAIELWAQRRDIRYAGNNSTRLLQIYIFTTHTTMFFQITYLQRVYHVCKSKYEEGHTPSFTPPSFFDVSYIVRPPSSFSS
jgi:hypothetical protein